MPVDRYGKIFFRKPPLNPQYNMPINRKPKKRRPILRYVLIGGIVLVLMGIFNVYSYIARQNNVHTDWPVLLTMSATGNGETAPVRTTNNWQLTWTCETGKPMEIDVLDEQGDPMTTEEASCTWLNTAGAAEMDQIGPIRLRVTSRGNWTVSIRVEPG